MSSGISASNPAARQPVVSQTHDQENSYQKHDPERPGYSAPERVDLDKVLDVKQSGGSFGDAFGRPRELQGEVSPKRGAAIDAQLEAEEQALLEQMRARKAESGPKEG